MNRNESKAWIKEKCGDGWLSLIDSVYDHKPDNVMITDTYQKWGALTFDHKPWDEEFGNYLDEINEKSMGICEICGTKGEERTVKERVYTLCTNHYQSKLKNNQQI